MSTHPATGAAALNLANAISAMRIVLTPLVACAVLDGHATAAVAGLVLVIASDLLDGFVARRRRQATAFGTLLDHGADAVFVTVLAGIGAHLALLPGPLAPLIALAFVQYVADSHLVGQRTLRPSRLGRVNGIAYYVAVTTMSVVHLYFSDFAVLRDITMGIGWLLVVTTGGSILERAWHLVHATRGS